MVIGPWHPNHQSVAALAFFILCFAQEGLRDVFLSAGMMCDSILVHEREVENHALQAKMQRRWIQASFSCVSFNVQSILPSLPYLPYSITLL